MRNKLEVCSSVLDKAIGKLLVEESILGLGIPNSCLCVKLLGGSSDTSVDRLAARNKGRSDEIKNDASDNQSSTDGSKDCAGEEVLHQKRVGPVAEKGKTNKDHHYVDSSKEAGKHESGCLFLLREVGVVAELERLFIPQDESGGETEDVGVGSDDANADDKFEGALKKSSGHAGH